MDSECDTGNTNLNIYPQQKFILYLIIEGLFENPMKLILYLIIEGLFENPMRHWKYKFEYLSSAKTYIILDC